MIVRSINIVFVLIMLLSVTACSIAVPAEPPEIEKPQAVSIGAFIGLSGDVAAYGISQKKGIELAILEINDGAYLGSGKEMKALISDAGATAGSASAAVKQLINNENVSGLIGPTLSSQAFSADPIAQEAGIPVIAISNTVPGITEMGNYIFRCSLPESYVIGVTIKVAASRLRVVSVAYLWGKDDDYTIAGYKAFVEAVSNNGLQVVKDLTFERGDTSFEEQLSEIISSKPDAILVSALAREAGIITSQARQAGYKGFIIGGNGFNSQDVIKQAGPDAEGIITGTAWNIGGTNRRNLQFISMFQDRYMTKPDQFAAQAYTATWLFANALRTAGSADPKDIRDALAGIYNFTTPLGSFSFTEKREPLHPAIVQIVRNGRFVIFNP